MAPREGGLISGSFVYLGNLLPIKISRIVTLIGERISLGAWYRINFTGKHNLIRHRFGLLEIGCDDLQSDFTYLEFGVASGSSMKFVANRSIELKSVELHGFDTFAGLHESHHDLVRSGSFNQNGVTPNVPGVFWHVGFFQDTFKGTESFLARKMFLMMDADLYSSTNYVLSRISESLKVGDLIYFDDLHIPNQERLALNDAIAKGLRLELVARTWEGRSALFRVSRP